MSDGSGGGRVDSTLYIYKYLFHPLSAAAAKCAGVKKDYIGKISIIPARALIAARSGPKYKGTARHPQHSRKKCTHNSGARIIYANERINTVIKAH
jgi:hypothetical protein